MEAARRHMLPNLRESSMQREDSRQRVNSGQCAGSGQFVGRGQFMSRGQRMGSGQGGRARVVTRRGVQRGCRTSSFSPESLARAIASDDREINVYLELDSGGRLTCRGGGARAAARACLAPSAPAASLLLEAHRGETSERSRECSLRLRLAADAPPHTELVLWFDETTLALLDMPFLTLRNITGKRNYSCHECGVEFDEPNPLKVHLFLKCQEYEQITFWEKCVALLRGGVGAGAEAAWGCTSPAELEALAAAWGRSHGGHVCVYCGKLYSRKYGLKIHIRTHTGYKPLRCRHCLRAFGDPSNLNKHVRLHAASPRASRETTLCKYI